MEISKNYLKQIIYEVNGSAIKIHKKLGPGLLESVYHKCLIIEFKKRNLEFLSEFKVPCTYDDVDLETNFRCDFLIKNILVVEIKAVEKIMPIHKAQLLTYMKLLNSPIGLLINFNVTHIYSQGQKTFVNESYRKLPEN